MTMKARVTARVQLGELKRTFAGRKVDGIGGLTQDNHTTAFSIARRNVIFNASPRKGKNGEKIAVSRCVRR
jgi:hypothetical protein